MDLVGYFVLIGDGRGFYTWRGYAKRSGGLLTSSSITRRIKDLSIPPITCFTSIPNSRDMIFFLTFWSIMGMNIVMYERVLARRVLVRELLSWKKIIKFPSRVICNHSCVNVTLSLLLSVGLSVRQFYLCKWNDAMDSFDLWIWSMRTDLMSNWSCTDL